MHKSSNVRPVINVLKKTPHDLMKSGGVVQGAQLIALIFALGFMAQFCASTHVLFSGGLNRQNIKDVIFVFHIL
jgi:hypothetical protein